MELKFIELSEKVDAILEGVQALTKSVQALEKAAGFEQPSMEKVKNPGNSGQEGE